MGKRKGKGSVSPQLVETTSPKLVKLDLGCGQNPKEGFEGVDMLGDKAKHNVDLFKFPWYFADASVDEIHCSHFLEHVPAREVEVYDILCADWKARFVGQDMLFAVIDECWRILKPECWMEVIVPSGRSSRAFWDPTHRRFFMQETFAYFSRDWRKAQGLEHYRIAANFGCHVTHSMPSEEGLRSAEVQGERFRTLWNVTHDWHAKLQKLP